MNPPEGLNIFEPRKKIEEIGNNLNSDGDRRFFWESEAP
jgi:hypothetical protein